MPKTADLLPLMEHHLTIQAGRALYAPRKQTVEPVFCIIRHIMGFGQFSMG